MRRFLFGLAAGVALTVAATPSTVSAHAGLESSSPGASSVLDEPPDQILLDFDEAIESSTATIQLYSDSGELIDLGAVLADPGDPTIVTASVGDMDDGIFAVVWRVSSIDGHVVDGAFSFQVGTDGTPADGAALVDRVRGGLQSPGAVTWSYRAARGLAYLGLAVVIGGGLLALLAGVAIDGRFAAALRVAWVLAAVGTVATVALYATTLVGGGLGDAVDPSTWADVGDTATGSWLLLRLGLVLALGAMVATTSLAALGWWRAGALALTVGLLLTYPMAGHAAATSPVPLWALVDGLHMLGASAWIGGLVALAVERSRWLGDDRVVADRFSGIALVSVPVIVATGVPQTLVLVGDLGDLTATDWGRVLLVKVVLVLVLVVLGAASRALLRGHGPTALRRSVAAEACVGIVVIGLAAGLVSLPPEPAPPSSVYQVSLAQAGLIADVTVTPGQVGVNDVHVVLVPPGGNLRPVVGLTVRLALEARGVANLVVPVEASGTNHFIGSIALPFSGDWRLDLVVEVDVGSTILLRCRKRRHAQTPFA